MNTGLKGSVMILKKSELVALLNEDSCKRQEELLGMTKKAILFSLKTMEMVQKKGYWVPHKLKP